VGAVVAETLTATTAAVEPGLLTKDLDEIAAEIYRRHGAQSAPTVEFGFPGHILVSVNDEVVHGIPGERVLAAGDIVTIDVTVELDGYVADAARTLCIPPVSTEHEQLSLVGEKALQAGIEAARSGCPVNDIGGAVEDCVTAGGFTVIRQMTGHGTGRAIWEDPMVPNFRQPGQRARLHEGLVLTIEPILTSGSDEIYEADDGWTVLTQDHASAAHWEHTIIITDGAARILTN
jgi:methionyl aminopeptidase